MGLLLLLYSVIYFKRGSFMESYIFDYRYGQEEIDVPEEIIQLYEKEAYDEFPNDKMMMEIHVLRAIKAYVRKSLRMATA